MTYTLTANQVSTIRLDSTDAIEPFLVNYEEMALFYDQTAGDYAYTVFKVVKLAQARYIERRPRNGDTVGMKVWEARYKQLCETLEFWQQQAGVDDTPLSVGYIDTALDAPDPSLSTS
jgi:hypothetical protein